MTGKLSWGKTGNLFCNLLQTSRKRCWRFTAHVETCLANNLVLKLLKVAKTVKKLLYKEENSIPVLQRVKD